MVLKHNVHVIDNIANDIFTFVSGIPVLSDTHAADMANFTIHLIESARKIQIAEFPGVKLGLRVGIHTGIDLQIRITILIIIDLTVLRQNIS